MIITNLINLYPKISITIISIFVTLVMTMMKKIQDACKIRLKEKNLKPEDMSKINKEMFECSLQITKHSMKPILFTIVPLILLIGWLRGVYLETAIAKTWLWWYIGTGVASSLIFRKIFKVI